jgi:hypothetical protein
MSSISPCCGKSWRKENDCGSDKWMQGLRIWNRDMSVDPAAIRNVLDDSSEPKAKSADPKRFYDNSIIQQVNREHAAKLFPGEVK